MIELHSSPMHKIIEVRGRGMVVHTRENQSLDVFASLKEKLVLALVEHIDKQYSYLFNASKRAL